MPFLRRFLTMFLLVLVPVIPVPAHAAMVFCNHTQGVIEAALGYREQVEDQKIDWVSEGWWRIEPGQCSRVYGKPLTQRFYYYYARSLAPATRDKASTTWNGKYQFCADTKAFRAEGDGACEEHGFQMKGFQEVDVGVNTRDYTLDFHDGN
jgi:uncharacterized membrane protein